IMIGTPATRNPTREGEVAKMYSANQTGNSMDMRTLDMCLKGLVAKGLISRTHARATAQLPESF
ncbi:twitching motility protein PilT, partial [Pseudomonas aeruginosa]